MTMSRYGRSASNRRQPSATGSGALSRCRAPRCARCTGYGSSASRATSTSARSSMPGWPRAAPHAASRPGTPMSMSGRCTATARRCCCWARVPRASTRRSRCRSGCSASTGCRSERDERDAMSCRQHDWTPEEIERRARALGTWFHNIDLSGVKTAPHHFLGDYPALKWHRFADAIPQDLGGASVLDIGCNAGFYSLEMKRRGAGRVLGIDSDETYLRQARFAASLVGSGIEFRKLSVYDVARLGERFDIVLFM